ncbi:conserved protein, unknown function [Hepatocystis sp. ex Piliocolobus tephrosceles]|nr:conserved protein, unknown function [Hepatocystis sp. ex Piliocolobus tephrosceles]
MLLLYIIFVVLPFLIFSYFVYKNVCTIINEKNKRNEFFSNLAFENKQYTAFENFVKKYEIEKYKYYLKVVRNIEVNYNMEILEKLITENNELEKKNEEYIQNLLNNIDKDDKYVQDNEIKNPQNSWMRKLANEDIVKLKVSLLKKAICFIPICNKLFQDKNKRHLLYNNYYIDDKMSKELDGQCAEFLEEFDFIIYEANCLSPNWGETIIVDAYKIYHHNKLKNDEEKKKKDLQKSLIKKQKQKEKKIKIDTDKANELANQLIQEENSKKKKKKK